MSNHNYFPTNGWRTSTPEAHQIDAAPLQKVADIIAADYPDMHSLLVMRHGYIVLERYYGGFTQTTPHEVRSITKSVISALIGIALKEGHLSSLDQTLAELLPEYFASENDSRKKSITLRHLLTMTSGFASDDRDSNYWLMRKHDDWAEAALKFPLGSEPGTQFLYDSASAHLLSVILRRATGFTALEYAKTRLFQPLGITVDEWAADPLRNSEGAAGLILTPRDMAKLGYLYLNGGTWDGQEIIPAWFASDSTRKQIEARKPEPADYGYLWWILPENLPEGYYAAGYGGQYVFVIPERDLIVVTTGNHTLVPAPKMPIKLIFSDIIPAAK